MGHGLCITYNKQSSLAGPFGRATDDDKIIGSLSWKLLKAMSIPPSELRGLGIQIQKLEATAAPVTPAGQARLSLKPAPAVAGPSKGRGITSQDHSHEAVTRVDLQRLSRNAPPQAQSDPALPTFSQVDMSVFAALPEEIRQELQAEYKQRSVTPAPAPARSPSPGPAVEPHKDLAHITRQLAPRSRPMFSPGKGKFWTGLPIKKKAVPPRVNASQFQRLGIDEGVFRALPVAVQREQLAQARGLAMRLSQRPRAARQPLKAPKKLGARFMPKQGPHEFVPPPPPPKAKFVEKPRLKRPSEKKGGGKVVVVKGEEVRRMIGQWVEGFREHIPHRRDVEYFGRYLEKCVESDTGIERAVGVVRWWSVLLRRYFGVWEKGKGGEVEEMLDEWANGGKVWEEEEVTSEMIGRAWWRIFGEIAARMSAITRKRFGGSLAIK